MHAGFGRSIVIKGHVTAQEDLVVSGRIEGTIAIKDHMLTISDGGDVKASVVAKSVIVIGKVTGDIEALERVELRDGSTLSGGLMAPRLAMSEGAVFNGTVEMDARGKSR